MTTLLIIVLILVLVGAFGGMGSWGPYPGSIVGVILLVVVILLLTGRLCDVVDTPAKSSEALTVGMLAQRLDGMDEAVKIIREAVASMPTPALVQKDVDALRAITEERFKGVADIFAERKAGVESALTAQKESAAKTETNFGEQISQTAQNLKTEVGALQTQTDDMKTRVTAIESRTSVTKEVSGEGRNLVFALISAVVAVGGLLYAFLK